MTIQHKNNLSNTSEDEDSNTKASELSKEHEGKKKANEEGVSLKPSKIPNLNNPYGENEENIDAEIVLPTKRSGCLVRSANKTSTATINVHKCKTLIPTQLVAMGCRSCYFYVMVPENHGICPKCGQGKYLIDFASHTHANKERAI